MTERKTITLNQQYQLRVDYDLREEEITIFSEFRHDGGSIGCHCSDIFSAIDNYCNFEGDKELLEKIVEVSQEIINWIDGMDIESLIAEHAQCERAEREAETNEDMERNG